MPCYNERTLILMESETWPSMHSNTFHLALAPVVHEQEIAALLERFNVGGSASLVVPSEYLEVVIVKR